MNKIKLYKKIPCLFGKHKQAIKPIRLEADNDEYIGEELYFCERCFKILATGYFPPHLPTCLCHYDYSLNIKNAPRLEEDKND